MVSKKILEKIVKVSKDKGYGVIKVQSSKLTPFIKKEVKLILREFSK